MAHHRPQHICSSIIHNLKKQIQAAQRRRSFNSARKAPCPMLSEARRKHLQQIESFSLRCSYRIQHTRPHKIVHAIGGREATTAWQAPLKRILAKCNFHRTESRSISKAAVCILRPHTLSICVCSHTSTCTCNLDDVEGRPGLLFSNTCPATRGPGPSSAILRFTHETPQLLAEDRCHGVPVGMGLEERNLSIVPSAKAENQHKPGQTTCYKTTPATM